MSHGQTWIRLGVLLGLAFAWPRPPVWGPAKLAAGECFDDVYTERLCCADVSAYGQPACWVQLIGAHNPATWPELFLRCCLKPARRRDHAAVLVPDVFVALLEPKSLPPPDAEVGDLPVHLVSSGLSTHPDGTFVFSGNTTLFINIGAHNLLEEEWVERLKMPESVLLCFEPDRLSFAGLRGWSSQNLPSRVSPSVFKQLHLLPCAVGPLSGGRLMALHRSNFKEGVCNSLLPPNPKQNTSFGAQGCGAATLQSELVLVVSLAEILTRLPKGVAVELLKIDAQGLDLEIVRSGGTLVSEVVKHIQVEVQDVPEDSDKLMYAGMHTKKLAVDALDELGFLLESCKHGPEELNEYDCYFSNRRLNTMQ